MENIGFRSTRCDALGKARGKEVFAADVYPENLVWAGAVRAGIPHGELIRVHTDTARNMDGVVAVLTRKDIHGPNRQGFIHWDMPVLCGTRVRHCGDAVALVLAENRSVLSRAVAAVTADIRPLPVVDSMEAALAPKAPCIHGLETGNVLKSATITCGDAAAAMAACDVVISETFYSPVQEHAFLETQNGVAHMDDAGIVHLTVSTQAPFRDRFEIARALGLDPLKIHVVNPFLGGGFGGKDGSTVQRNGFTT
jgi:CO/xanthine dehydrogenase Mo-binding subunit